MNTMCKLLIETCLKNAANKFELVLLVSKKAQNISLGKIKLSEQDLKYKATYLALKELNINIIKLFK
ncbi:MAG TPA: DNA-directed RNA polymerase subunit omega [Candidatus Azoamicus sp. OHIO2]